MPAHAGAQAQRSSVRSAPDAGRVAIGTAQFGSAYGVANSTGRVSPQQVEAILSLARREGVRTLDTAVAYGSAEAALGAANVSGFDVITKIPAIPADVADVPGWMLRQVEGSLARIGIGQLDGVLMHRAADLAGPAADEVFRGLEDVRARGYVRKIGISGYSPEEVGGLVDRYVLDVVQIPFNIFDRRALETGLLERLASLDVEVHVRSVFLQGLLLMGPVQRPAYFARWAPLMAEWDRWLGEAGLTALEATMRFVFAAPQVSRVVLGFDSAAQLAEALAATHGPSPLPPLRLSSGDLDLINPSHWKLT